MREEDELSTKTTPRYKKPAASINTWRVTWHTDSSSHSPSRIYTRRMILLDGWSVSSINRAIDRCIKHMWQRTFPFKAVIAIFGTWGHQQSPIYSELGVLPGMFSPKRSRWPPPFFYISDITNSLSFNGKNFRKKSNVLKILVTRVQYNFTGYPRLFLQCSSKNI